jgi:hypothetical protein
MPGRLGQHGQLLIRRITSATLDPTEHFDSFDTTGHSRITRRTPRLLAMQLCPAQMGAAPTGCLPHIIPRIKPTAA